MVIEEFRTDPAAETSGAVSPTGDAVILRSMASPAICIVLYAVLSTLLFGHLSATGSASVTGPQTVDQIAEIWWLKWAQFAIWHGHSPFTTDWQNYPVGINALVNPSMLALGTVASPITRLLGPIVSWNILVRAAVFSSAVSMCLVLHRWARWWPAAFVGGLLYGFSAYETFYGARNLQLSFLALPPVLFLIIYEIMFRQRWRPSRTGIALGAVVGIQFLISTEILVSSLLFALFGCALFVAANRETIGTKWFYIKHCLLVGLVTSAVLLLYPLIVVVFGPGHIDGVPNSPDNLAKLHGDLLGLFVPSSLEHLGQTHLASFWVNSVTLYVGAPFILITALTVIVLRRRGIVMMAGLLMASAAILSLGSNLYVDGHNTHIPLPFVVLAHLPGTGGLLATRISMYTVLFGAAIVAIGLDALYHQIVHSPEVGRGSATRRKATAVACVAIVAAAVGLPMFPSHAEPVTASGVPTAAVSSDLQAIPSGSTVLAYPYPDKPIGTVPFTYAYQSIDQALLDQAVSGMNYKVIGGYDWRPWTPNGHQSYGTPQASKLKPAAIQALFGSAFYGFATPAQKNLLARSDVAVDLRLFMQKYKVGTVVVLPLGQNANTVITSVDDAIGKPSRAGVIFIWYDVQRRLPRT